MKILVKKIGGFAGIIETIVDVDITQLPVDTAKQIELLVREARFFELSSIVPEEIIGADMFRYELTITDNTKNHTVNFGEHKNSQTTLLWKLVDTLRQIV